MRRHHSLMLLVVPLVCGAGSTPPTPPAKPDAGAPTPQALVDTLTKATDDSRFLTAPKGSLDTLVRRVQEKNGHPVVVVQYGDSHTQAGFLSRELRGALAHGGIMSPGFVAPGWHHLGDANASLAGRWKTQNWLKPGDTGSFGPLGTAYVTQDAHARVALHLKDPPASGVTVTAFYLRTAKHLPFRLVANGVALKQVDPVPIPRDDERMLGHVQVTLPPKTADVELQLLSQRRSGELRFFGFEVQYPNAVVEWDALGVQGTAVDHPVNRGDHTMEEYLGLRSPDLLVVWYGSNSLVAPNYDPVTYGKVFESFLVRLKTDVPTAARLVIGPPDLARRPAACPTWASPTVRVKRRVGRHYVFRTVKRKMNAAEQARWVQFVCAPETLQMPVARKTPQFPVKGIRTAAQWMDYLQSCQIRTLPAVSSITEAERSAALRQGYAFFDTYAFMDGAGSIHHWVCQQPQLARFDHVHLTPEGYATVGQGIWASLQSALHMHESAPPVVSQPTPTPAPSDDASDDGDDTQGE